MENLCNKVFCFKDLIESAHNWGAKVFLEEIMIHYDEKKTGRNILLVSHELARTGAPVAIYHFAKALKENGDNVFLLSPVDGALRESFTEANIPQIIFQGAFVQPLVKEWIPALDAAIICTTAAIGMINLLGGSSIPVLWWIHEANTSYHKGVIDQMPAFLPKNIKVYCGGERALASLKLRRPSYNSKILLYSVPDYMQAYTSVIQPANRKYTVLCIGVQEFRKGQDILAEAFDYLNEDDKEKIRIIFVGRKYYDPIWKKINQIRNQHPESIVYISELPLESLRQLELQSDCIVSPSRDDPMPIVLTEMMMMSKTVITSEHTGQAPYIQENKCGYVYEDNNPQKLADVLSYVINHPEEQKDIQKRARILYERLFSENVFYSNAKTALDETISECQAGNDETVSVVIPTYNGKEDLLRLIPALLSQKRVNLIEIILIDSGSKDGSDTFAEQQGCKVIRIRQEDFSHSFARNLGASKAMGKYVLFMTQDALPENEMWLSKMVEPLIEGLAVAVSCRQIPRDDCDLYGKVTGQLHAEYMLFPYGDRILTAPVVWEVNAVRKNAQLDDVACLINKEVFYQFQYRGDYAEDLDLGLRLIKSGYHLVLLNSAKVIHSHKRPAFYHLRRAIVDNAILNNMLNIQQTSWSAETIVNRSVSAYLLTQAYVNMILAEEKEIPISEFKKELCEKYQYISDEIRSIKAIERKKRTKEKTQYFDEGLVSFVEKLSRITSKYDYDNTLFGDVLYFAANSILDYLLTSSEILTKECRKAFCDAFVKRLGTMIGIALTCHRESENVSLTKLIAECRRGI